VESPRGRLEAPARITGVRDGVISAPFHYGSWDQLEDAPGNTDGDAKPDRRPSAANELTITDWDPVSKQPLLKTATVRVEKLASSDGSPSAAPTTTASQPAGDGVRATLGGDDVRETVQGRAR
jgi:ferredoxin-nitrate reductase